MANGVGRVSDVVVPLNAPQGPFPVGSLKAGPDVPPWTPITQAPTPAPAPIEQTFTYAQVTPGWTLVRSENNANFLQLSNKTDFSGASHYMAIMEGSSAAARLSDFIKTTPAQRAADLFFEVSVDGGPYNRSAYNATQDDFQLFSGLTDAPHVVAMRTPNSRDEFTNIPKATPPLRLTGAAPKITNVNQWLQPGLADVNVHVANGLAEINSLLDANSGNAWRPQKFGHYFPGGAPSMMFRADVTELWFVTGQRLVHVWDGTQMRVLDTGSNTTAINSEAVKTVRLTGLSGLKTYWVWTSWNGNITYFAVGLVGGTAQAPTVAKRSIHQYGDSITRAQPADALSGGLEANGHGYSEVYRVAARLGYVGSACGVGGYSVAQLDANIADWLSIKTVTANDVAIIAIGQNGGVPDTSVYNSIIDKLLAKGYGRVVCRGVLPVAGGGSAAPSATISNIVSTRNDPKVKFLDVSTWTAVDKSDGIHPIISGYAQLDAYETAALPPLIPA